METLLGDLRLALRMLVKAPLFALLSIGALALGIGANAVMFGVIETVLLEPLVYRDSSRLVMVQTVLEESGTRIGSSPPDFYRLREKNRSFEGVAALYAQPLNLTGAQEPERVRALHVTANLLPLSGVEPAFGRGFSADDEKWGSQPVALISDALWHTRFGGDRSVLGRTLALGGEPATIIGVLPKGFSWPRSRSRPRRLLRHQLGRRAGADPRRGRAAHPRGGAHQRRARGAGHVAGGRSAQLCAARAAADADDQWPLRLLLPGGDFAAAALRAARREGVRQAVHRRRRWALSAAGSLGERDRRLARPVPGAGAVAHKSSTTAACRRPFRRAGERHSDADALT